MKLVPLNVNIAESAYGEVQRSKRAELMGEICERLIEWAELENRETVHRWLTRIATLGGDPESQDAIWLYLRIGTGDLSQLTASFTELGSQRKKTKQAQQQEDERARLVIARHFPELHRALADLAKIKRGCTNQETPAKLPSS